MRLLHPRLWIAALVLTALLGARLAPLATAHDATPTAATCNAAPVDKEHVLSLWYDADHNLKALPATPAMQSEMGSAEVTLPMGQPADSITVAGVTETVAGAFDCFMAGDFVGALGYFTDHLITSFGPEEGVTYEQAEEFLNTPPEPDPDQSTLVSVANVMKLADGTVGAFVIERRPNGDDIASYGIFVNEGDVWKVDAIYDFPSADDSNG